MVTTNFKYFEGIVKYRSKVSIPEIGIKTRYRKVLILQNGYHGKVKVSISKVSIPDFGMEYRYRKVLIPEKGIDTQDYSYHR